MKDQNRIRNTNTIDKIKNSLIELLKIKPLQKITINDICKIANINRSTFYLHYYDQYELHDDLKEEAINELLVFVNQSFVDGNYQPIVSFLHACKSSDLVKTYFTYSDCHDFYKDLKDKVYPILFEKTSSMINENDRRYIFAFILDGSSSIIAKWINEGCKESEEYISKLIIKLCMSLDVYNNNQLTLKEYNGQHIDLCDEHTRYFLSMIDKDFQANWMSKYPITFGHDRQNISFEIKTNNESEYEYYFADNKDFNNPFVVNTNKKYLDDVGIFVPGKTYYWKVVDKITKSESKIDSFNTIDSLTRWISAGSVYNMRDLGGFKTIDNKQVRYGLIYRGGQLSLDNKWEKSYMNDYSYKVFDYLNIKSEVELRGGYDHEFSQIHKETNNVCINGIGYEQIFDMSDEQKEQYRGLFKKLANKDFYPMYFHCSWGADRTGVLAFLISGVLGVSYENVCEDYELTSLSGSGRRSRIIFPWKEMYPKLKEEYGNDKTLKELINDYLINYVGVKQAEIDSLRKIMLEEKRSDEITHKVTYRIDGKVYVESLVFDGQKISMINPIVSMDKCLDYWMLDNKRYDNDLPVHNDLILDAKIIDIEYEKYDSLSISDIGLNDKFDLSKSGDFKYNPKVSNGSRVFSFDYKIEASDNNFDDGVHIEIGTLWDYKAHIWLQNQTFQHVYIKKDSLSIAYSNYLEYGKTYRIDVGVLIPSNSRLKGHQILFLKIDGKYISIVETKADLSVCSIGLAGTKGILYDVRKK